MWGGGCVPKMTPASMPCLLHTETPGPSLHTALIHAKPRTYFKLTGEPDPQNPGMSALVQGTGQERLDRKAHRS